MKKKTVVTGGAGFIGSNLAEALVKKGYEVHVVDNLVAGKREYVPREAVFHQEDVLNTQALVDIFSGVDTVFHLAALPSVPYSIEHPEESAAVNLGGTLSVLEAARLAKAPRVVFSSSSAVYGNQKDSLISEDLTPAPESPYGLQKLESEKACGRLSKEGLSTVSLRYFNVYGLRQNPEGPYASVIPKFIDYKKRNLPFPVFGDGTQTRDFVHVGDVVAANILAMESGKVGKGEIINIGTGRGVSVNEVASLIGGEKEFFPPRKEILHSIADNTRARELLGWKPSVAIEDGIRELL